MNKALVIVMAACLAALVCLGCSKGDEVTPNVPPGATDAHKKMMKDQ